MREVGESSANDLLSSRLKTKVVWLKHFPEEPFDLDESKAKNPREFPNGLVSKIGYNIEEAALRQRDFYYQVRLGNLVEVESWKKRRMKL